MEEPWSRSVHPRLRILDESEARVRRARRSPRRPAASDPGEITEVVLVSLERFRQHLPTGRLTDVGPGYLALDALGPL